MKRSRKETFGKALLREKVKEGKSLPGTTIAKAKPRATKSGKVKPLGK
jgi:hypothetical protein